MNLYLKMIWVKYKINIVLIFNDINFFVICNLILILNDIIFNIIIIVLYKICIFVSIFI